MKIGDKVKTIRKRKNGEIYYESYKYKKGKIIAILPQYCVVRLEAGYNECFKESELILDTD